jgi:hypothetical protein
VLRTRGENVLIRDRIATVERNIETVNNRFPGVADLLERDFSCNFRKLYEVTLTNLKNRLVSLQKKRFLETKEERNAILDRIRYMETKFGENSSQASDEKDKLLRFDDIKLKERATTVLLGSFWTQITKRLQRSFAE